MVACCRRSSPRCGPSRAARRRRTSSTAACPMPSCWRCSPGRGSARRSSSDSQSRGTTNRPRLLTQECAAAVASAQKGHAVDRKQLMEWSDKHLMTFAKRYPVALVRGEGVRVWDSDGKEYLDFTGGIAVTALGHSHPRVVGTMREQAAKLLCEHSFADRVFFSNSGAEANEAAFKLARKWAKEHGSSDRGDIISMRGGFHGRTLATVTATAQEKYHHGFEPLPAGFKYVPFNDLRAVERAIDS